MAGRRPTHFGALYDSIGEHVAEEYGYEKLPLSAAKNQQLPEGWVRSSQGAVQRKHAPGPAAPGPYPAMDAFVKAVYAIQGVYPSPAKGTHWAPDSGVVSAPHRPAFDNKAVDLSRAHRVSAFKVWKKGTGETFYVFTSAPLSFPIHAGLYGYSTKALRRTL